MLTWDDLDAPNYLPFAHYQIIRRNGAVVPFEASKTPAALVMQALGLMLGANRKLSSGNLVNLFKQGRQALKLQTGKLNGFFSASKASLRNAP